MKKFTLFSLFWQTFVAAFSFTSCNTDGDSYTPLTLEQQKSFRQAMACGFIQQHDAFSTKRRMKPM